MFRWGLFSVLLIAAGYLTHACGTELVGFQADDALYLLMADYWAPQPFVESVVTYVHRASHFPPLYPLILGLVGGGSRSLPVAHLWQNILMCAGFLSFTRLAWVLCRSVPSVLLMLWICALMPATVYMSTEIWSEFAYLLWVSTALIMAEHAERQPAWWWGVALFGGAATVTRSLGAVLVIALAFVLARRGCRRAWPTLLLAVLPLILAAFLGARGGAIYVRVWQSRVHDYHDALAVFVGNLAKMQTSWWELFSPDQIASVNVISALLLPLMLTGWWLRLRAWKLDAVYVGSYLAVLVIWPFPEVMTRLLYPLVGLALIYSGLGTHACLERLTSRGLRHALWVPPLLLLIGLLPTLYRMAIRYQSPELPPALEAFRMSRYWLATPDMTAAIRDLTLKQAMRHLMDEAGARVPPGDCIYAAEPQAVMFYARRLSWMPPVGAARTSLPSCRFHLLLSDRRIVDSARALWQPNLVILTARVPEGIGGVLVQYPENDQPPLGGVTDSRNGTTRGRVPN